MFDWFWDFLYLLTKSIFRLIDCLIQICNQLCGITPVKIDDEEVDLIRWLLGQFEIANGFKITAMVSIFLVVFFAIWGILRAIFSEKPEMTPQQVLMRSIKTVLTYLFVPLLMFTLMEFLNVFFKAIYVATSGGNVDSFGSFLAYMFGRDCWTGYQSNGMVYTFDQFVSEAPVDYRSTSSMRTAFDLNDYDFFFSWITGITILIEMTKIVFIFVDRMFSIVILFIISPIPISAAIIDDGQHFKSWREQVLVKFCVGYTAIIGVNIYGIIMSRLCVGTIHFFDDWLKDFVMKLVLIIGCAVSIDKIVGLVGNLLHEGAGDSALEAGGALRDGVEGAAKGIAGLFTGGDDDKGKSGGGKGKEGDGKGEGSDDKKEGEKEGEKNPDTNSNDGTTEGIPAGSEANPAVQGVENAMKDKKDDDKDDKKKEENKQELDNKKNNESNPVSNAINDAEEAVTE